MTRTDIDNYQRSSVERATRLGKQQQKPIWLCRA